MDLIALVACKDMRLTLEALLARHQSLEIRPIRALVRDHPDGDAAVLARCHHILRSQQTLASHALVMFDLEGCGSPLPRETLEELVETKLAQNGWAGRSAAVVIDPELEVWFWSDSPHVEKALGWTRGRVALEEWLVEGEYSRRGQQKPHRPKEAVRKAWKLSGIQISASNYSDLASKVSFQRCADTAFLKLMDKLKQWFPAEG